MKLVEATMLALQGKLEAKNLNEMKPFEAAKYKGKEWGVFGNKCNAWLVFGTEKEMKAKADELNRQEGNYEPDDEELFAEARSHKEDNEKAAPRTVKNALGNDVETREMVDVSNPDVGNKSYHNEKGNQYWGTTEAEYASKRNKTGQKNEYGYDVYLAPFKNTGDWTIKADRMEPATATARYQYQKEQGELLKPDLKRYRDKEKRARNPENKEYWKNAADNIQRNIDDYDKKAKNVIDQEKEKRANKKTESAEDVDAKNIEAIQDIIKKSGITNERTVDLMSKDILKDLKRNYTKGCKDEYGNYYGTVITDAFRKKVQQITGKMPNLKIGESKKVEGYIIKIDKDGIDGYWGCQPDAINNNNNVDKNAARIFKSKGAAQKEINKYRHEMGNAQIEEITENKEIKEEAIGRNRKIRKKVESLNAPVDDQAYWAYVLGYDFLQDYFKNSSEPECDLTFEKAWKIADDFMHSEEFQDTSKSGYDALVDYLKNRKLIESKITEDTTGDTKKFTLQVSCGKDDAIITLDINKNASFDDVIKTLKNELYDFPKNFNKK